MKIIVLGAGLVGNVIARDLMDDQEFEITIADINQDVLDHLAHNYDLKGIYADLSNPEMIKDLVKDYDLVISHVYPMNLIASYTKRKHNVKYQFHNHGAATPKLFTNLPQKIYMWLFNYLTNLSIRNADSVVSISNYLRKILLKETGIDSKVVYDKINERRFNKKVKGDKIRKKYSLSHAVQELKQMKNSQDIELLLDFIENSKRGILFKTTNNEKEKE